MHVNTFHLNALNINRKRQKPLTMHLIFSKASSRTSCIDIKMTRKGNYGQVGNSSTCATRYIFCFEKTGSLLFYQFCPPGFLKMVDDGTGKVGAN